MGVLDNRVVKPGPGVRVNGDKNESYILLTTIKELKTKTKQK